MTTKILLSPEEMALVNNTDWILTKHIIIKKVFEMFGDLTEIFKQEAEPYHFLFPEKIKHQNGKITKGENYKLLPYVILDYPGTFLKDKIFAIRTMFWWGNFFSVTLHLSGLHKQRFTSSIAEMLSFLQKNNFFICINKDEWQHHFEADNYLPVFAISLEEFRKINEKPFFKIAKKIPLSEWENADEFLLNSFKQIMQFLQLSYQAGKKDPLPAIPKAGFGL